MGAGRNDQGEMEEWNQTEIANKRFAKARLASLVSKWKLSSLSWFRQTNTVEQSTNDDIQPMAQAAQERKPPPELPPTFCKDGDEESPTNFKFSDLQQVQYIEDKTHEVLLVLRLNSGVLEALRQHYQYVTSHSEFPAQLASECEVDLVRFNKCILGVEKDLSMLRSRTETLLRLLENRKNLVSLSRFPLI
jgi:hypothetical protein